MRIGQDASDIAQARDVVCGHEGVDVGQHRPHTRCSGLEAGETLDDILVEVLNQE